MTKINLSATDSPSVVDQIQANAQYVFKNIDLFNEAMTHPSFAIEHGERHHDNQRLEFLGDAVLQIILSDLLYKYFTNEQEGVLTRIRSLLADEEANASYTLKLGLDATLLLGKGEAASGGRKRPSILGDLFEAFLGAIYLDGGIKPATKLVKRLIRPLDQCRQMLEFDENPKGTLQTFCQTHFKKNVAYRVAGQSGPPHAPTYIVEVTLDEEVIGYGTGSSRKEAERKAAADALVRVAHAPAHTDNAPSPDALPANDASFAPIVTVKKSPRAQTRILALDFDGVICDSAAETAASAWHVAHDLWPDDFADAEISPDFTELFRRSRPYLETGFQAIPMLRCLMDGKAPDFFSTDFKAKIQSVMDDNGLTKDALVSAFGKARDQWMTRDMAGWVGAHGMYPGTVEALKTALTKHRVLILTTKQERFVKAILAHHGVDFPDMSIFGLDRKVSKETELAALVGAKKTNIHFVEDRIETLERIKANTALKRVKLHYAPWGYGTSEHLQKASDDKRIDVLTPDSFAELLG